MINVSTASRKLYVVFHLIGGDQFKSESSAEERANPSTVIGPPKAYAFHFVSRVEATALEDDSTVILSGGERNEGSLYYHGGRSYTVEEMQQSFPEKTGLIEDMQRNGMSAVQTRLGTWQFLRDGETAIRTDQTT